MKVRAGMSPLVSHEIKIIMKNASRITLSWGAHSNKVVYAEILGPAQTFEGLYLKVINAHAPIEVNARNIVSIQEGYDIYKQTIHHKNDNFKKENPRIKTGARHRDIGSVLQVDELGDEFEKHVDIIFKNITI